MLGGIVQASLPSMSGLVQDTVSFGLMVRSGAGHNLFGHLTLLLLGAIGAPVYWALRVAEGQPIVGLWLDFSPGLILPVVRGSMGLIN